MFGVAVGGGLRSQQQVSKPAGSYADAVNRVPVYVDLTGLSALSPWPWKPRAISSRSGCSALTARKASRTAGRATSFTRNAGAGPHGDGDAPRN